MNLESVRVFLLGLGNLFYWHWLCQDDDLCVCVNTLVLNWFYDFLIVEA